MERGRVLVSGAGVAGLALAYWLRRHGFAVTVVERAPALRHGGQAIDIRGTARTVVERMGLADAVRAHHTGTYGMAYLDADGRVVARLGGDSGDRSAGGASGDASRRRTSDFGDSGGVVAELEILRGDLVRLLHDAGRDLRTGSVEHRYGDVVTGVTEHPHGVEVAFREAGPETFDVVVGADGVRSGVRELAFGPHQRFVHDLGYYTCYFTARTDADVAGWMRMYNLPAGGDVAGVGGRVLLLYPVGDTGEVRAMFSFFAPPLPDVPNLSGRKRLLRDVFADGGWQVPTLLAQLDDADDVYLTRAGAVHVEPWSRGRSVLLGDAAFGGSPGMGTSMALVGAYVLAGELAGAGGDHARAFAAYEHRMRAYVRRNQRRPPGMDLGFAPQTRHGIRLRNLLLRLLPHLPGKQRLTGGLQQSANATTLADYRTTLAAPS